MAVSIVSAQNISTLGQGQSNRRPQSAYTREKKGYGLGADAAIPTNKPSLKASFARTQHITLPGSKLWEKGTAPPPCDYNLLREKIDALKKKYN